jgi:concanavalin A-like lectin/glucanase superfamily protein
VAYLRKTLRTLILALSLSISLIAQQQIQVEVVSQQKIITTTVAADTWQFSAWTPSGGNFNGGRIIGTANDDNTSNNAIEIWELTGYSPTNSSAATISLVNALTGYGGSATFQCLGGSANTWKSYGPFSYHGKLYMDVFCQDNGPRYFGRGSTMIVSDDNGLHWANPVTYAANDYTVPHNSTTAAGDNPGTSAMLWCGSDCQTDTSNPMSRIIPIQVCQDFSVNCPTLPVSDCNTTTHVCFITERGDGTKGYLARVDMTASGDALVAANWSYWTGSGWSSSVSSISPIFNGNYSPSDPTSIGAGPGVFWAKDFDQFVMIGTLAASATSPAFLTFSTAAKPWGPWMRVYTAPETVPPGFPTPILALYNTLSGAPPHATIAIAADGGAGPVPPAFGYAPGFIEVDLERTTRTLNQTFNNNQLYGPVGDMAAETATRSSPFRFAIGSDARAIPRAGLQMFLDFFDHMGATNWPWIGSTDLLGNTYCNGGAALSSTGIMFDASHNCATPGNAPAALARDNSWTITADFSTSDITANYQSIVNVHANSTDWFGIYINANGEGTGKLSVFWVVGGALNQVTSTAEVLASGVNYHLTVTKAAGAISASNTRLYLGSMPLATNVTGNSLPTTAEGPLCFGQTNTTTDHLTGTLYGFALWNRVLSLPEIVNVYDEVKLITALPTRGVKIN